MNNEHHQLNPNNRIKQRQNPINKRDAKLANSNQSVKEERERSRWDLADVALRDARRRGFRDEEWYALVFPGKLIGSMHLLVAFEAQRRLVGAAKHPRLRHLASTALNPHILHSLTLSCSCSLSLSLFVSGSKRV